MTYSTATRAWACVALASITIGFTERASAGDYYTAVPFLPTVSLGVGGSGATLVGEVYGKEYSHTNPGMAGDPNIDNNSDHNAFGVADPLQVVSWDGLPGGPDGNSGSRDAFDFGSWGFNLEDRQVDALANRYDFLFGQVIRNQATLLFSVTADAGAGAPKAHVHFEDPDPVSAADPGDIWAAVEKPPVIPGGGPGPGVNHHDIYDLDALEVWGPEPSTHNRPDIPPVGGEGYYGGAPAPGANYADSNRFSVDGDALATGGTGTSVWAYDIPTGFVSPWIPHSQIVDAIEALFLPAGTFFDPQTRDRIDVDGTMARDINPELDRTSLAWGPGDELLFTIDPLIDVPYYDVTGGIVGGITIDGGEIMHLVKTGFASTDFAISFLDHGGHLWDTKFDVMGTFGYDFEDVDALEAVGVLDGGDFEIPTPEPTAALLACLAGVLVGFKRTRD